MRLLLRVGLEIRWVVDLATHMWTGGEGMNSSDFIPRAELRKT